jgi:2-C-methyl-D-erythritol 2,4-cyclodiphosphate synthase
MHFPDSQPQYSEIDSRKLLRETAKKVTAAGFRIVNVDSTIVAQAPRMAPHIARMIGNIATDLGLEPAAVSVKATTNREAGLPRPEEGIAAQAIALIE